MFLYYIYAVKKKNKTSYVCMKRRHENILEKKKEEGIGRHMYICNSQLI